METLWGAVSEMNHSISVIQVWREQFWQSIKSFDTEDKVDLYFFRPAGFVLAKLAALLDLTPTMITLFGMCLGIWSGFLFYQNDSNENLVWASFLFVLAGVFDSADGQLARITNNFSKVGLVLDGVCDNIVFGAVYIGSILTLQPMYGWKIWIIAIIAGICHSAQSSVLDFYNREYLCFGFSKINYWNPSVQEIERESLVAKSNAEKISIWFRKSWLMQQQMLSTRTLKEREEWKVNSRERSDFAPLYREHNRLVLRLWRPLGANVHTIMIIVFSFLRRFDLYLLMIDIGLLTLWFFIARYVQAWNDQRFRMKLASL